MKQFKIGDLVEPSTAPFAKKIEVTRAGEVGRVIERYFYRCEYHYDVLFSDGEIFHYNHACLRSVKT